MERVTQQSLPTGWKKYAVARHKLETATRACTGWLATYATSPISIQNYSRGYLGSVRWAVLSRPSGEPTKSSVLQVTLVPYRDTGRCLSVLGPSWKLLVYSWMGKAETRALLKHLKSTMTIGHRDLTLFCVTAQGIVRLW